jgi:DNA-binding NtrC family response regulator
METVKTILIVDDEEAVRRLASAAISKAGFRVLEAGHGVEALRIFKDNADAIHLVISDLVMPEMGGRELADAVRAVRPETKVLLISGYADSVTLDGYAFLPKPFTTEILVRTTRELVSGRLTPASDRTLIVGDPVWRDSVRGGHIQDSQAWEAAAEVPTEKTDASDSD